MKKKIKKTVDSNLNMYVDKLRNEVTIELKYMYGSYEVNKVIDLLRENGYIFENYYDKKGE